MTRQPLDWKLWENLPDRDRVLSRKDEGVFARILYESKPSPVSFLMMTHGMPRIDPVTGEVTISLVTTRHGESSTSWLSRIDPVTGEVTTNLVATRHGESSTSAPSIPAQLNDGELPNSDDEEDYSDLPPLEPDIGQC